MTDLLKASGGRQPSEGATTRGANAPLSPWIAALAGFVWIIGSLPTIADADAPSGAFVLHRADGAPVSGPLLELSLDWSVELGDRPSIRVPGSDVVALRRMDVPLPPPPRGPQVLFANGDRLGGAVHELVNEQLILRTPLADKGELRLPLTALRLIWLADPANSDDSAQLRRRLLAEERDRDVVWLRNGDVLEGTLVGLDRPGPEAAKALLRLDVNGKEVTVERNRVAVVALNTELALVPRPRGPYGRLILDDGSRLSLTSARLENAVLRGETLFGASVRVPVSQLVALDLRQGRAIYLSDLKPRRYEHTPYLGIRYPYMADASVAGRDLRLAGGTYDKGLGLHSQSSISYDLAGHRRFQALVGLDEQTGRAGSVRIKVLVDSKMRDLGWDQELTAADGTKSVDLDVQGAKELTLVVEFGRGGDVQDHVNWVDARLIR